MSWGRSTETSLGVPFGTYQRRRWNVQRGVVMTGFDVLLPSRSKYKPLVRYLDPKDHNSRRITQTDKDFDKKLDFKDIKFPVKIRDVHKIEE